MEKLERVEMAILRLIAGPGGEVQLQQLVNDDWMKRVRTESGRDDVVAEEVFEAIWSLLAKRLLYFDIRGRQEIYWTLRPTANGQQALKEEEFNPYDRSGFIQRLRSMVPTISADVLAYVDESVGAFHNGLFLSSTVMLGAASEAAFLELADSFSRKMLSGKTQSDFNEVLKSRTFIVKMDEFSKRLDPKVEQLPPEVADGLDLQLRAVLDAFRRNRNDAGHPTGRRFTREECYTSLNMAALYLRRLYALKTALDDMP
ncbi:MAG: hypothetical protein JNL21_40650 [Myxococcales bacterium]|nr:hypothetical protein [Myxococcales bacterium]